MGEYTLWAWGVGGVIKFQAKKGQILLEAFEKGGGGISCYQKVIRQEEVGIVWGEKPGTSMEELEPEKGKEMRKKKSRKRKTYPP